MKKMVIGLFKIATVAIVACYLLACLIPFLPAGKFWMVALLGLGFPILMLLVLGCLVMWLIAKSKWAFLPLVALILSWKQISVAVGFNTNKKFELAKGEDTLRVLTWNISSWDETSKTLPKIRMADSIMASLVKQHKPDIICFQEFFEKFWDRKDYDILKKFKKEYPYSYFIQSNYGNINYSIGVVIISKYPIIDSSKYNFGEDHYAEHLITADIQFNAQRVRIFTTHLQSVRFENTEYNTIRNIKRTEDIALRSSKTLLGKLKTAYKYRAEEADFLRKKIEESPYPAIVCGDFNDVPNSYTYFKVRQDLQDAFLQKGGGFCRTFRYLSPTLRIDYILADKQLQVLQFARINTPFSDHYPLIADFKFETKK